MDELVNQVAVKTGLSPDQARMAVEAVVSFLKARLPAQLASQIDAVLGGGAQGGGGLLGGLGGMFGGKR